MALIEKDGIGLGVVMKLGEPFGPGPAGFPVLTDNSAMAELQVLVHPRVRRVGDDEVDRRRRDGPEELKAVVYSDLKRGLGGRYGYRLSHLASKDMTVAVGLAHPRSGFHRAVD